MNILLLLVTLLAGWMATGCNLDPIASKPVSQPLHYGTPCLPTDSISLSEPQMVAEAIPTRQLVKPMKAGISPQKPAKYMLWAFIPVKTGTAAAEAIPTWGSPYMP